MKSNIFIIRLLLVAFVGLGAACTANYEEINRDPNGVGDAEMSRDDYNIVSALVTLQNNVLSTDINRLHQTDCLLGGAWGRYMAESKAESWPNKFSTFDPPADWTNVLFNEVIPRVYPALAQLEKVTENPVALSVANILKVLALHRVTDTYGPIPYSKIGQDGKLTVAYDSQRDVYIKMFEELNAAIVALSERENEKLNEKADLIYKGNIRQWVKLANSLKLRLAIRMVFAEPTLAQQYAEEAVNHRIGVMSSNTDNAALTTFGNEGNPMNVALKYNAGDNRSVADMTLYMNAYGDPRRAAYFVKSRFTGVDFCGFRSGVTLGGVSQFADYSIFNINQTTPLQWMNVAEVMFLRAEGTLHGWNMGGLAADFYKRGVELSLSQWGVSGADAYLANTTVPGTYTDPKGTFTYNSTVSTITVKWSEADSNERKLERIITQKWLANFPLGLEAWADRRRTGYPHLLPVYNNNSSLLAAGDTPRRCPYPVEEGVNNAENYAQGVQMLGGVDNIATRLWWDCKQTDL